MAQDKQVPHASGELTAYLLSGALQETGTDDVHREATAQRVQL
jgi:hypothetical protein